MKVAGKMHFAKHWLFESSDHAWWVCFRWDEDAENWRIGGIGLSWEGAYEQWRTKFAFANGWSI